MVVSADEIHPLLGTPRGFDVSGDACVHCNNQLCATILHKMLDRIEINAIAFLEAARDVVHEVAITDCPQKPNPTGALIVPSTS